MKYIATFLFVLFISSLGGFAQVGINSDNSLPLPSAGLDVKFTDKGLLPPRMTKLQMNNINQPADGLIVYCTDCGSNGLGALSLYMVGAWYNLSINCVNPLSPVTDTHVATANQIIWNWKPVSGATGYRWNTSTEYATATDMGIATTKTETLLTCNTLYTRYIWAYNSCGISSPVTLTKATSLNPPASPSPGTNVAGQTQITWNWNTVSGASGYKWNTINSFATAIDMGTATTKIENALACSTSYTRYVWAYSNCGSSTTPLAMTQITLASPPAAPSAGTHVPSVNQIQWKWNIVSGATGYKWNTTNSYTTAIDMGTATSRTETGLTCITSYTRYVWAYGACGVSTITSLTQATLSDPPVPPTAGTNAPSPTQIVWNWNIVAGATGYKWSTANNYASAVNMGTLTTKTETALTCSTAYTRYAWAYNNCGNSTVLTLSQSTTNLVPLTPTAGTHIPSANQIVWNWNAVAGAAGYKWNTSNNYPSALEMGTSITKTETNLTCNTPYTRYVWAYTPCGYSIPVELTQSTSLSPPSAPVAGTHLPSAKQIVWNWEAVSGATSYKWNTENVYATATELGNTLTYTETDLTCSSSYTRYLWAYNNCGVSTVTTLTQTTLSDPPNAPTAGTNVATATEIVWNWNTVPEAAGYKWNTTGEFASAADLGSATTYTESSLACNTAFTRYVWAYNSCGRSDSLRMSHSTGLLAPPAPVAGNHEPSPTQIIWRWVAIPDVSGYKWNTSDDYASAVSLGETTVSKTETNLICNTSYTRYIWSYDACGVSTATELTESTTLDSPGAPTTGNHVPALTEIVWNWNIVSEAAGYKWNTSNDYASAIDMGTITTKTETDLICGTPYARFVWSYSNCGGYSSASVVLNQTTSPCPACGITLTINHVASGGVAPVNKTATYETVLNIPGLPSMCWITSNLGSSHQATAKDDSTEASAGWYWQFNRKQGYRAGLTLTPAWTISSISENSDWVVTNDPCALELGIGWRLPTRIEWMNVDAGGNWTNWNGPWGSMLKLHAAGELISYNNGSLGNRGVEGYYWSSTQELSGNGRFMYFTATGSNVIYYAKAYGFPVRCIKLF